MQRQHAKLARTLLEICATLYQHVKSTDITLDDTPVDARKTILVGVAESANEAWEKHVRPHTDHHGGGGVARTVP